MAWRPETHPLRVCAGSLPHHQVVISLAELPEDKLLFNPLVRDEMARTGNELYKIEIEAGYIMGAIFGWFMAAIFYGGLSPLVAAGFGSIGIVAAYGLKKTMKGIMLARAREKVFGKSTVTEASARPDPLKK